MEYGLKNDLFKKYEEPKAPVGPKVEYSYQEIGVEMNEWFSKKDNNLIWSLFTKFTEAKVREAFTRCKKYGKKDVAYLMTVLKNLK